MLEGDKKENREWKGLSSRELERIEFIRNRGIRVGGNKGMEWEERLGESKGERKRDAEKGKMGKDKRVEI